MLHRFAAHCSFVFLMSITLFGCAATYTVEIENTTRSTVEARLMQDVVAADPLPLAAARIPPGQSATLGPVQATITDDVNLRLGQPEELGLPDNGQRLYPGRSAYQVIESQRGWSGIELIKAR
jgi:hypothetical protein